MVEQGGRGGLGWLGCGVVAGPVFLAVWVVQVVTREGFDWTRHPLSLLSLGEFGWVQVGNFVVCGVLYLGFAAGVGERVGRAAAVWVGAVGVGLIVAGVFVTDAGAGFPPGAPEGRPEHVSVHGVVHEVGFGLATVGWLGACVVLGRWFGRRRERGWVWACVVAPVAVVLVDAWPDVDSLSVRLVVGTAVQFGWLAAVAVGVGLGFAGRGDV